MRNIFTKYTRLIFSLLILLISAGNNSCKKFIEIDPAPDLIATEAVFNNDKTALAAVNGVYVQMRSVQNSITDGGMAIFPCLTGDEIYNTIVSQNWDPFFTNSIPSENSSIYNNFWLSAYSNIYRINVILDGLSQSVSLREALKTQLTGELKMLRGWLYFNLVNLFGDVPLVLTADYRINAIMPRTPGIQIYQAIVADLLDAQTLLLTSYPSAGKVRPNKWTATTLLARTYLYTGDWTNAEIQASAIINSGAYSLVTDFSKVFLISSNETIWELAPVSEILNTAQGTAFIPSSATSKPILALTANLLTAFETGDLRKTNWLKSNINGGLTYFYPFKYKERVKSTPVKEYNIVFRLAELYLVRAEARMQLNNLSGAINDLNILRGRAGLPGLLNTLTQPQVVTAIAKERQVELFTEWGHRWFDLKRTNRLDIVMAPIKGTNWQVTDALYPIPYRELQYNPFLIQNPGY